MSKKIVHEKNYEQWSAISEDYHDSRPVPPDIIVKTVLAWLGKENPDIIVDVGCGTGLSAIIWKDIAARTIGIEPNADMRVIAEKHVGCDNITFADGVSNDTGLADGSVDVITVSQAFHWMDIDSSLAEFYRILKPGGVLAIYDFALPPVMDWQVERAYLALADRCSDIYYAQQNPPMHNDKSSYSERIKSFGKFRYSREIACHGTKKWDATQLMKFVLSTTNAMHITEIDATIKKDLDELFELIKARCYKDGTFNIIFPYAMMIAIK